MSPLILLYIALILIIVAGATAIAWRKILSSRTRSDAATGPIPHAATPLKERGEQQPRR